MFFFIYTIYNIYYQSSKRDIIGVREMPPMPVNHHLRRSTEIFIPPAEYRYTGGSIPCAVVACKSQNVFSLSNRDSLRRQRNYIIIDGRFRDS